MIWTRAAGRGRVALFVGECSRYGRQACALVVSRGAPGVLLAHRNGVSMSSARAVEKRVRGDGDVGGSSFSYGVVVDVDMPVAPARTVALAHNRGTPKRHAIAQLADVCTNSAQW